MLGLYRSHSKLVRIVLGAVMVLVSLSMLTYLIPTFGRGEPEEDIVVARIGKETITLPELARMAQEAISSRHLPRDVVSTFIPSLVQEIVTERALAYEAQRLGFQVSDAELRAAIAEAIPGLYAGGRFVGRQGYTDMLAQEDLTIPDFEARVRRQILISRLLATVDAGVIVTPQEAKLAYRQDHEQFKILWVKLTPEEFRGKVAPGEENIEAYYLAHRESFKTPEKEDLAILIADRAKLEQSLHPPEADLRRMYTQNIGRYRVPESVDMRQILLERNRGHAKDIVRKLRAGADFASLAKEYSEDTNSAQQGGEYRGVRRGQLEPALEQVAFSLQPGQISDPVQTSYGTVIIQVEKHQSARVRPFAEVSSDLAEQWKQQRGDERMQEIASRAPAELQKDFAHPEKVASQFQMQLVRVAGFEAGNTISPVGAIPGFYQAVAGLAKGKVSQAVPLSGNRLAIAAVEDLTPARPATLDEARIQIRDILIQTRSEAAMRKRAEELFQRAKSMAGDLEAAAKSMGLQAKTSSLTDRSGDVAGLGSLDLLGDELERPEGALFGPVRIADGTLVGKMLQKVPADMSGFAAAETDIVDQIRRKKIQDGETMFEAGLRERLTKEGKLRVKKQLIDRLARDLAA